MIFPEIENLFGVPQPAKYHPEIDTGIHTLLAVDQAALLSNITRIRFAALVHDLGKAVTPPELWPSHRQHETKGLAILELLCKHLRIPNDHKNLASQVMRYHTHCHRAFELKPGTLTDMLSAIGAIKKANKLDEFLIACKADLRGRTGLENQPYPQASYIEGAQQAAIAIDTTAIKTNGLQGAEIGAALRELRIEAIARYKKQYSMTV